MTVFKSAQELIERFDFKAHPEYQKLTPFTGTEIGFSIQRNYPDTCAFKPPRRRDGTQDTVAIIHVLYNPDNTRVDEDAVPIIVDTRPFSRFLKNRFDYDFENPECPTKESVEESRKTATPLRLLFRDEFFYDNKNNVFFIRFKRNRKTTDGVGILDHAFNEHCATVGTPRARRFRRRIARNEMYARLCDSASDAIEFIMKRLFGRVFKLDDADDPIRKVFEGYKASDMPKQEKSDTLNIFGYQAAKPVIVLFCLSLLALYTIVYFAGLHSTYLKNIAGNNLLALSSSIVLLWIMDVLIPKLLFKIMRLLFKAKWHFVTKQHEFK